jgi:hypothetical protein
MKKALVSLIEPRETGYRIASVNDEEFLVAEPLFWVDCDDTVAPDAFWYDPADRQIKAVPEPEPEIPGPTPPSGDLPVTEL